MLMRSLTEDDQVFEKKIIKQMWTMFFLPGKIFINSYPKIPMYQVVLSGARNFARFCIFCIIQFVFSPLFTTLIPISVFKCV